MIKKTRPHITQNEPLLFEISSPGKKGYQLPELDVPAVDAKAALGADNVRDEIEGLPGSKRSRSHPSLHAPFDVELRHRSRHVSAGLLHDEVQPAHQRDCGADRGLAWAHPYQPEALSQGAMEMIATLENTLAEITGHGRGDSAAGRRRARRDDRHLDDPRFARIAGQSAQEDPDSRFGARNQSGYRQHFRLFG